MLQFKLNIPKICTQQNMIGRMICRRKLCLWYFILFHREQNRTGNNTITCEPNIINQSFFFIKWSYFPCGENRFFFQYTEISTFEVESRCFNQFIERFIRFPIKISTPNNRCTFIFFIYRIYNF